MNDEKIVLIARVKVKADKVEELKSAALKIVADSRNEEGCINYDIHQSVEDETIFFGTKPGKIKPLLMNILPRRFFKSFLE